MDAEILEFWAKQDIFKKSIDERNADKPFIFFEGPPSINAMPGIHHVMSRTIKDVFARFHTLKGERVDRKGGWDTHGLPIELNVEKTLGITKKDIGTKISVEEYNRVCRQEVTKYKDKWDDITQKMGYWVDLDHPYITYTNEYMESLWSVFKIIYDKGYVYKGFTIQPYSPAAGTQLSSHEVNQPGCYRDVKDVSAIAQFKVIKNEKSAFLFDDENEDVRILAWTTTPWTLPSNVALAVGEKVTYVKIKTINDFSKEKVSVIIAKDLFVKLFSNEKYIHTLEKIIIDKGLNGNHTGGVHNFDGYDKNNNPIEIKTKIINEKDILSFQNLIKENNHNKGIYITIEAIEDKVTSKFNNIDFYTITDIINTIVFENQFSGKDLAGISYEQLLPYVQPTDGRAFEVIIGDFVTTTDGTGVVHIAPSFGADDMRVAKQQGMGNLTLVDKQGKFLETVNDAIFPLASSFVKEAYLTDDEKATALKEQQERLKEIVPKLDKYMSADDMIVLKLKIENNLFKTEKYEHSYPHCWRTDKPIIYYPLDSWFIRTTAVKDRMVALNHEINWKPKSTGEGRFGQWLENVIDWNLSRSRFWGTPIPIWRTEDGEEIKVIGTIEDLKKEINISIEKGMMQASDFPTGDASIDLHKPYIDRVILVSDTGKAMKREEDLMDVWFDSGAMPYAQWHYPVENEAKFKKNFPADFIAEGVDQTRGWFYTLHAISTMLFDSVAYKNVVSNGHVLDKNGNKMSKRLGNGVDPFLAIGKYGADAVRWYMMSNSNPWDSLKFSWDNEKEESEGIVETQRKFFGTLYNTYSFFALYANIDGYTRDENQEVDASKLTELDKWILSKLQNLIKEVTAFYDEYEPTQAARAIEDFVDAHLSNWYVRLSRRRFWKGQMSEDKKVAYDTLFECLVTVSQLMSPIAPFFSDWLYKNLTDNIRVNAIAKNTPYRHDSVHLSILYQVDASKIDAQLEERMGMAQDICSMVLSLRKKEKIKVRQPLQKILIPVENETKNEQLRKVENYILSEVNVKEIEYVTDTAGIVTKKAKPNFKALGPKLGAMMKSAKAVFENLSQEQIIQLERDKKLTISIEDKQLEITTDEVEIISEDIPGWIVTNLNQLTVALDINLTPQLLAEGNAREFVNKVQNLRKDKDFNVTDRILVEINKVDKFADALNLYKDYICNEILAEQITVNDSLDQYDEIDVNETMIKVNLKKSIK
jgi:isoleucyl-tRNA synthetase